MKEALEILEKLTLEEKINLLHGDFLSGGVPRLGIPRLLCADGPIGIRACPELEVPDDEANNEVQVNTALSWDSVLAKGPVATSLPSTMALAATFNMETAREYGKLLGRESLAYGMNVIFGPGINLMRDPRTGRNFEYMGEDPFLAGEIACAYIEGVQQYGVAACAKHYFANDREKMRHYTSSNIDAVTAREVHLRPFQKVCQKAHVWSMMTGNNLVNGVHVSESAEALDIPRKEWAWDGVILTDWRAAYDAKCAMDAGLDMTTGFCEYVYGNGDLLELVHKGTISTEQIDEKALRVLTLYLRSGVLNPDKRSAGILGGVDHFNIACEIAAESMVLLKNDNANLPLKPNQCKKLLLTGPGVDFTAAGTGSSNICNGQIDERAITILDGIRKTYGASEIIFEPDIATAMERIDEVDAVLFCACSNVGGEGREYDDIRLPDTQEEDIIKLGQVCHNLIVILQCGDVVNMSPWVDSAKAVLVVWYGGQMLGEALGNVLSGQTNPSGKLPCTFGKSIDDYPCEALELWPPPLIIDSPPENPGGLTPEERKSVHAYDADYKEGLLIGYRWFEKKEITPLFPFGFGLSYTTFELADAEVRLTGDSLQVECMVTNTGRFSGGEVVQVYVAPPAFAVDRPVKELKGFGKVFTKPGETRQVNINIPLDELAFFYPSLFEWAVPEGDYEVLVGTSSNKIDFRKKISLSKRTVGK